MLLRCERFEVEGNRADLADAVRIGVETLRSPLPFETEAAIQSNLATRSSTSITSPMIPRIWKARSTTLVRRSR